MSNGSTSILTGILDGAAGSAQGRQGTTIQTLSISLGAGFVLFGIQFGLFLVIRNYLWSKRIYQPRAFLIPMKDRVKPPPNNPLKWLRTVFKIKEDTDVLQKAGMDAYFFLRYLSMCLKIFAPMTVIILPTLLPLNYKGGKMTRTIDGTTYNVTGLDTIAWSNVPPEHTNRYWAHLVLAVAVVIWVCYIFHSELMHYILKRQDYLGSPSHRLKASSTTVLITSIPHEICNPEGLMTLYDDFPGGIRRIWVNRDFNPLVDKDKERKRFEDLLENAETNLIRKAVQKHAKQQKRRPKSGLVQPNRVTGEQLAHEMNTNAKSELGPTPRNQITEPATKALCRSDLQHDLATKAAWTEYLKPSQRQTMRVPRGNHTALFKIPLIGRFFSTRVDTIYFCRRELARLNHEIEEDVKVPEAYPENGSAFIQFGSQKAAHLACQSVADTAPRYMTKRTVELSPADINWASLNMSWKARYLRLVGFLLLFSLLVLAFGIISFLTGILSRASTLGGAKWLKWIGNLPPWVVSFVQGTLPPVIQVIILSGPLPILLRSLTNNTRGATTGSEGERSLQLWYLVFLLIELFIIPTISSGLTSIVQDVIEKPGSVPNILAENLPTASNYYFSFLVVQALSISASSILQTIRLFNFYVLGGVNTPDSVYNKLSWTNRTRIGSNIPWYTTFAVIGLVYSIIAPLVLIFMILTFSLFWIVIKNNILYVIRTGNVDGGGLFFPSAINQTFTGLYFMEICLIGLFFLVRDDHGKVACKVQGIIMAVVLVLTALYQIWLAINFNGLLKYAPVRLEEIGWKRDQEYERERLIAADTAPDTRDSTSVNHFDANKQDESASSSTDRDTELVPGITKAKHKAEDYEDDNRPALRPRNTSRTSRFGPLPRTHTASSMRVQDIEAQQRRDEASTKRILNRLNRPLDEHRLAELENRLGHIQHRVGNVLVPRSHDIEAQMMDDPISRIIMQHNDELENLEPDERDMLLSVAFTHPVLRETRPSVWIPGDDIGVSDDEVRRTKALSCDVAIENRGAFFDKKLKVRVDKPPPDMSEFAFVMAEL